MLFYLCNKCWSIPPFLFHPPYMKGDLAANCQACARFLRRLCDCILTPHIPPENTRHSCILKASPVQFLGVTLQKTLSYIHLYFITHHDMSVTWMIVHHVKGLV